MDAALEAMRAPRRRVRMIEVAAAAGVSRSTVSNVMRGLPTVDESVKNRVLKYADQLGYIYDRGAASLRSSQSRLIGLIVPHIANPFIAEAIRGVNNVLSRSGYLVTAVETEEDVVRQSTALRSFAEHRVDGFIVLPAVGSHPRELVDAFHELPVVIVNRDPHLPGVDFVGPDDSAVARLAADHLLVHHRCRRVAYFGGPADAIPRNVRASSFQTRADDLSATVVDSWSIPCEPTAAVAYEIAQRLLTEREAPDGLFCHSDTIAFGVMRALRDADVSPAACRVIGCDDLPDSAFWNPSVTSVSVQPATIGRVAAQRLLRQLGDDTDPDQVPQPRLIVRESCGCKW